MHQTPLASFILIAQKAKKATASECLYQTPCCGFYSFLIIGRAVTIHCFFSRLEVSKHLGKKTMHCKSTIASNFSHQIYHNYFFLLRYKRMNNQNGNVKIICIFVVEQNLDINFKSLQVWQIPMIAFDAKVYIKSAFGATSPNTNKFQN